MVHKKIWQETIFILYLIKRFSRWKISNYLMGWETAQKHSFELFPGTLVPEKRSGLFLQAEMKKSIKNFLLIIGWFTLKKE